MTEVSIYYDSKGEKKHVAGPITLKVSTSETCAIIGPSGCGKTSLLRILAGVQNNFIGKVRIDGEELKPTKHRIAYIPQNSGFLRWKTIRNNCLLPVKIRKVPLNEEVYSRLTEITRRMEIEDILDRYPSQVSGGQLQRAAVARSLILKPDILLMDEPFSALDALTREYTQNMLRSVLRDFKATTVLVTHSIEEAIFLADRVIVLSASPGKIIGDITTLSSEYEDRSAVRYTKLVAIIRQLIKDEWDENSEEESNSVC
ncbi:ABC transporter ATP-binding protein [Ruminiclostridium josui]|uniref:ABC transporter ATP-binding protein n=1 Tax=Ruminiclostridium josui TaxID=1499 RepID=UPI001FA7851A|nr:ATP-binding cassette domain-containing protein [Ruminiclostridium josui]